jgi:hypothetical protein
MTAQRLRCFASCLACAPPSPQLLWSNSSACVAPLCAKMVRCASPTTASTAHTPLVQARIPTRSVIDSRGMVLRVVMAALAPTAVTTLLTVTTVVAGDDVGVE